MVGAGVGDLVAVGFDVKGTVGLGVVAVVAGGGVAAVIDTVIVVFNASH